MYLLLVAGLPASGKSTFAAWAAQRLGWPVLGKDDIKECLFDTIGFNCHEEKRRLDKAATMTMYYAAGQILARGQSVVLDNNFWEYSRPEINRLIEQYGCKPVTVRFEGDIQTLFNRYETRDKDPNRHLGHVLNCHYPPVEGEEEQEAAERETWQSFEAKYRARGTLDFAMGPLIRVDATDFSKLCYDEILLQVKACME
ncbi:MAG: ATP-binding protein [Clostridiales bacterium]|nr:ATP-binding protein [Clostridiales bacterium]